MIYLNHTYLYSWQRKSEYYVGRQRQPLPARRQTIREGNQTWPKGTKTLPKRRQTPGK